MEGRWIMISLMVHVLVGETIGKTHGNFEEAESSAAVDTGLDGASYHRPRPMFAV